MAAQIPLAAPAAKPNLANVQGDIVEGLQKRTEAFLFFTINDVKAFRHHLKQDIAPLITSTKKVQENSAKIAAARHKAGGARVWLPITCVNLSFTVTGLTKLGVKDADIPGGTSGIFAAGQVADAIANLGDPIDNGKLTTWKKIFLDHAYDGVFTVTASDGPLLCHKVHQIEHILGKSAVIKLEIEGVVRPGAQEGHEHFGFLDGVSVPAVRGVNDTTALPGQDIVDTAQILLGYETPLATPVWAKDGSFMVFRQLEQLVPEFHSRADQLAAAHQKDAPGVTGAFIEARMVGRWPSGASLVDTPGKDDPSLGCDKKRNNNFDYTSDLAQERCPFAAHVRKTNPRSGISALPRETGIIPRLMVRQGIPYGPEVTLSEARLKKTQHERGLLFVSFQASIEDQFQFTQKSWANSAGFPFGAPQVVVPPGVDAIIGQAGGATVTTQNILDVNPGGETSATNIVTLHPEVIPRGGVYLFTPSISALCDTLGA